MNHLVHRADGCTPFETLASLDSTPIKVLDFHTFGCPCYVLDDRLQSGLGQIPKWEPRSWMGIYVGRSPSHASNFGLILNPAQDMSHHNFMASMTMILRRFLICVPLMSFYIEQSWLKPLLILRFKLSDKWAHGNLFRN